MKINAEIICRQNKGYGVVCEWKGPRNGIAKFYREYEDQKTAKRGDLVTYGRLKLRIIAPLLVVEDVYMDAMAVMLESPHAQLFQLYREKAESIVRLAMRFEAAFNAFRFKCNHGSRMPVTSKVADILL